MQPAEVAGEPLSKELRYWRERRAAASRAGDIGAADVAECDAHLTAIEARGRAARPWAARVQAATDTQKAAEVRLAAAELDLAAARAAVMHFDGEVAEARAAATAAQAELAAVRAEGTPGAATALRMPVSPDVAVAALRAAADAAGTTLEALLAAVLASAGGPAAAAGSAGGLLPPGGVQGTGVAHAADGGRVDAAGTQGLQSAAPAAECTGARPCAVAAGRSRRARGAVRAGSEPRGRASGRRGTSPDLWPDDSLSDGSSRSRSAQRRAREADARATLEEIRQGRQATLDGLARRRPA
jgi:hypothetical protein